MAGHAKLLKSCAAFDANTSIPAALEEETAFEAAEELARIHDEELGGFTDRELDQRSDDRWDDRGVAQMASEAILGLIDSAEHSPDLFAMIARAERAEVERDAATHSAQPPTAMTRMDGRRPARMRICVRSAPP